MAIIDAIVFGWLGAVILFITTVSPTVFTALDQEQAGRFLRAYFPKLFAVEVVTGLALFVIAIYISFTVGLFTYGLGVGLSVSIVALLNLKLITPTLNDATDRWMEEKCKRNKRRFILLHSASVGLFGLNALSMIALITFSPTTTI